MKLFSRLENDSFLIHNERIKIGLLLVFRVSLII